MTKTNKGRVFIRRWAVRSKDHSQGEDLGLVDFKASPYTVTGVSARGLGFIIPKNNERGNR